MPLSIKPWQWPGVRRLAPLVLAALLGLCAARSAVAAALETSFGKYAAGSTATVDHAAFAALLKSYVLAGKDGINRVDYRRLKSEGQASLKSYIAAMEAVDPATLDRPEQFAFWANLYNAKTLDVVLEAYPVKSIKDINLGGGLVAAVTGGPWKAKVLKVKGVELSLDDIEHGILRPIFKDPRVHYAANCASLGCPNLNTEPFTGAKLEDQLDAAARAYVNHPRGFSVTGGAVRASSIYDWYQKDFGGTVEGVLVHAQKYAEPGLKEKLKGITDIAEYGYDWNLNDTQSGKGN